MNREFISILDKRFQYTPASKTDIRVLFERIKKEISAKQKAVKKELRRVA